jgi:tetratricopeptide (TPR) repeat protein
MAEIKSNKKSKVGAARANRSFDLQKILGLTLAAFACVLYWNTLKSDYVFDDFTLIKDNDVTKQGVKAIPEIFTHFYRYGFHSTNDGIYRPLSVAMFALEWSISPNNPALSHFVNILFYALTAWLIFNTLCRLLKNYNMAYHFIIVLLFIVHPVHTEVVSNIKSRDELMCFFFSFGALYFAIDFIEGLSNGKLGVAALLFFLALLSKETAITMLIIIPVSLYFFTSASKRSMIYVIGSLLAIAFVFLILRAYVLGHSEREAIPVVLNPILLASNTFDRMATAIKILGDYFGLLVFPNRLLYDRSFNEIPIVGFSNVYVIISLLLYGVMIFYSLSKFLRKDLFAYGTLFFLIIIVLFSNIFFYIGVAMADRFLYSASFGFCFVLATLLMKITKTNLNSMRFLGVQDFFSKNKKVLAIVIVLCCLYSFKTVKRSANWKDNYTLFSHDAKIAPNNALIHYHLGYEIIKNKAQIEDDQAKRQSACMAGIEELKKSLYIYPDHTSALNTLGVAYFLIDSMQAAERSFIKAYDLDPNDPSKLGEFYTDIKAYEKAIDVYKTAILKNPNYLGAYIGLGVCYGSINQFDLALNYLNKALVIQPNNAKTYYFLSMAYKFSGDTINYEKCFQKAQQLNPSLFKP